jgi:hypothetical protein
MHSKEKAQIQADSVRRSVKSKELIDALTGCALGSSEMTSVQVRAAEVLLKKSVPDLSAVTLDSGPEGITIQWKS